MEFRHSGPCSYNTSPAIIITSPILISSSVQLGDGTASRRYPLLRFLLMAFLGASVVVTVQAGCVMLCLPTLSLGERPGVSVPGIPQKPPSERHAGTLSEPHPPRSGRVDADPLYLHVAALCRTSEVTGRRFPSVGAGPRPKILGRRTRIESPDSSLWFITCMTTQPRKVDSQARCHWTELWQSPRPRHSTTCGFRRIRRALLGRVFGKRTPDDRRLAASDCRYRSQQS